MNMYEFIRNNREAIDRYIDARLNHVPATASCDCPRSGTTHSHEQRRKRSDEERRQWILNDEFLYDCARNGGVPC